MATTLTRRQCLGAAIVAATALPRGIDFALAQPAQPAPAIPIIDTHIHLFDPTRPQGVPWPSEKNKLLYQPALPARFRDVTKGLGIVGAIEVECSPWLDDNQWVLDVAATDTIVVGTIGNLEPGKPEFAQHLERFQKNPLFRGLRYGNLWGRNLGVELDKPPFVADLKRLADAGLTLDTANPTPQLLAEVVRVTDLVPGLRIVIDHLPKLARPEEGQSRAVYDTAIKQLAQRPQVYVKVSAVLQPIGGNIAYHLAPYKPKLDELYDTFGPDRLLFGSDWPNSDPLGTYQQVLAVVREYFMAKGREIADKYFWKNSMAAYRWVKRSPQQPAVS
jgi:predicted TIM-barrel fold metal-dependent hydrolase